MTSKKTPLKVVEDFIKAVYPESTELAPALNTEESCLRDATETISELRKSLAACEKERDEHKGVAIACEARAEKAEAERDELREAMPADALAYMREKARAEHAEAERDGWRATANKWGTAMSEYAAEREKAEDERDEALRDVQQLHDAAVETEDKLDALKAEVEGYKNAYEIQKAHNLREGELAREVREVLGEAIEALTYREDGQSSHEAIGRMNVLLAKMGGEK